MLTSDIVHNVSEGQPPAVIAHLDKLRAGHPNIIFEFWSETELLSWHVMLDDAHALSLYGPVPTQQIASGLSLEDLKPVIDVLERREPDPNEPLPAPPSVEKLEKNALSAGLFGIRF